MAHVRFHERKRVYGEGSHTRAHTAKQGAFRTGALLLPSERSTRFGNPAWPDVRTAYFAAFGSWSEALLKDAESLRASDALMRVAVPRRRGPAGLRDLFRFCRNCGLYILRSGLSACARHGWYHYHRRALRASETPDGRLQKQLFCRFLRSGERRSQHGACSLLICRYSCRQIQLQTLLRYDMIKLIKLEFEKEGDCMKQIIINYLFIFGLPVIIGLAVRIILQRFNKAYLVTTLFAILTAIGWYIANAMPSYGSELHGILAIQTTVVFVSSLLTGLILRLKKKRIS